MPQTGICTDVTCTKELTELYECHCCNWLICLKHLLEHVTVSKRHKKEQLDILRNDLIAVSCTLEGIVENKIQEIEHEKGLIDQAKTLISASEYSMEEIQHLLEEMNQAVLSNGKEETIVKVESSLSDMKTYSCNNEIFEDKTVLSDSTSSAHSIVRQPVPPPLRVVNAIAGEKYDWTMSRINHDSMQIENGSNNTMTDDDTLDSLGDVTEIENCNAGSVIKSKKSIRQCPLTFDGAFGLTKAKHSIDFCTKVHPRNILCHLRQKHKLKDVHVKRLVQAVQLGLDPMTTILFNESEVVIDPDCWVLCPFNNNVIHLIDSCPSQARNIPCQSQTILKVSLILHLKQHHKIPHSMAKKLHKNLKKPPRMILSNSDNTMSP